MPDAGAARLPAAGLTADWQEWAAHNLAMGISEARVREQLARAGFAFEPIDAWLARVRDDPLFIAAKRAGAEALKWRSLADALVELEGQAFDHACIPRLSGISGARFQAEFYAANRPVILTDLAADWPALTRWTLDYLKARFGHARVRYQENRSAADHRDSFVDHGVEASFSDYIDLVAGSGTTNAYYLIAHDRMLDRPELRPLLDDIRFDPAYFDPVDTARRVFFWLGPAGTRTPMHRDLGNVWFVQVRGRKRVRLIPSKLMHRVYNEVGYHSEADFDALDLDRYPLLRDVPVADVVIAPGEMLFIPLGWWHHVSALDLSITLTGNNFAFPNSFAAIF